ncbi:MAG TPA: methyltransferase domain-containing protein [Verrucomicrobiae bacterium]|nr:methyltransferase domain-containing protein [Verrucomicrobiae bacterium]
MNWTRLRGFPWLDTRAQFVAGTPQKGNLLDLGSSDGETLGHIAELRPDLRLFAVDVAGAPDRYPPGCEFVRADLERDRLPWPNDSMDAITCMHLVEHLRQRSLLLQETARLLKPGGRLYLETPHPKSLALGSPRGKAAGTFTLNFYDDPTHIQVVSVGVLARELQQLGLAVQASGISRNWLFALAYPLFLLRRPSRQKFTARIHWLGWSAYVAAGKPAGKA